MRRPRRGTDSSRRDRRRGAKRDDRPAPGPGKRRNAKRGDSGNDAPRRDGPRGSRHPDARPASVPRGTLPRGEPLRGDWLLTTRAGSEQDLAEEIDLALSSGTALVMGPGLVRSRAVPTFRDGGIDLAFARQGFRIAGEEVRGPRDALAKGCVERLAPRIVGRTWALDAWVPDTDAHNPLARGASALGAAVARDLDPTGRLPLAGLPTSGAVLAQLALVAPDRAFAGTVPTEHALTLAPGGRARMRVGADRPSRAARKVEEALAWLGVAPGPGELCVDLGAAPGGWTWALLERGASVIAVDPAKLREDLMSRSRLEHRMVSAFQFEPDGPCDWLFCDMAWRPLEVAQLLAKWGRRRWARFLVANLKLPMKKKAETVHDLKRVIAGGAWQRIRARQLYHDRDEVTVTAHLHG